MGPIINNTPTKEAKVIKLYPELQSNSNSGTFSCPAVNLINSLSAEVNLLKELILKQNGTSLKFVKDQILEKYAW